MGYYIENLTELKIDVKYKIWASLQKRLKE